MSIINSEFPIYNLPKELLHYTATYLDIVNFLFLLQTCKDLYTHLQDVETNNSKKLFFLEIFRLYFPKELKHITLQDFNIYYEKMRHIMQIEVYCRLRERSNRIEGIYANEYDHSPSQFPGSPNYSLNNMFNHRIKGVCSPIFLSELPTLVSNRIIDDNLMFDLECNTTSSSSPFENIKIVVKDPSTENELGSYFINYEDISGFVLLENKKFFLLRKYRQIAFLNFNVSSDVAYKSLSLSLQFMGSEFRLKRLPRSLKRKICMKLPDYQNDTEESLNNQITKFFILGRESSRYGEILEEITEVNRAIKGQNHKFVIPHSVLESSEVVQREYLLEQKGKLLEEQRLAATHLHHRSLRNEVIENFLYEEQLKEINQLTVDEQNDVYGQMYVLLQPIQTCLQFGEFAFHRKCGFNSGYETRMEAILQTQIQNRSLLEQFYTLSLKDQHIVYEKLHLLIDPAHTNPRHGEFAFHCVAGLSSSYFQRKQVIDQRLDELPSEELNKLSEEDKNAVYAVLHKILNPYNTCLQHGEFAFHRLFGFSSTIEQRNLALEIFYNEKTSTLS